MSHDTVVQPSKALVPTTPRWYKAAWKPRGGIDQKRTLEALKRGDADLLEWQIQLLQLDPKMEEPVETPVRWVSWDYAADLVDDFHRALHGQVAIAATSEVELLDSRPRSLLARMFGRP